jgi:hypothetical protein
MHASGVVWLKLDGSIERVLVQDAYPGACCAGVLVTAGEDMARAVLRIERR